MSEARRFGLSAALVSPFDERGRPDLARLVGQARAVLAEGCDSITLFGTTGEGFSIPLRERATMLGAVAGAGISLDKVYAGVSATTVAEAAEQAELALSAGVKGLLVAPPFYLKGVDDEGLYGWFHDFLARLGSEARGVILYHIPGQTAVPLSSSLVRRLRDAFSGVIAGIKDSSGDWATTERFLADHGDIAILVGDERLLARAVRHGAEGSICGLANITPALLRPLVHEGRDDRRVNALVEAIVSLPVLPAVKALVAHRRGDKGYCHVRPPLMPLAAADREKLVATFEAITGEPAGA
ncbi:dihydrodipicolinate synthase family protein [Chelatococcus daeguensis]|uniref:Dihydrodipicolinate synthase family protein n=1 Tax=Chelatococcus daeguensis TaxID=444444 RepID=A0AAC9JNE3_9HYPH|nr:dihydrodipicolinate synthase family protein [Chelatococcus daeguensis]APF36031.1 dihydrodipicolinate synthase family protein [Chelatococcus daeguensis]